MGWTKFFFVKVSAPPKQTKVYSVWTGLQTPDFSLVPDTFSPSKGGSSEVKVPRGLK